MKVPCDEAGWVFPLVLSSIVLLAGFSAFLTTQAVNLGSIYHDGTDSSALHEALRAKLIPSYALPRGCSVQSAFAAGGAGSWWVCSENEPRFSTIPTIAEPIPYPDFDLLLADAEPCQGARQETTRGRFTSPVAPFTCTLKGPLISRDTIVDNLDLDFAVIEQNDKEPLATIISPGYLMIRGELSTARDLLVVTGGTVHIERIRGIGRAPIRVTVLSSRGDIEIDNVSGALSLLVIGRAALRAPPTPFLPPFPLPRERFPTILGIAPYRAGWN